MRKPVFFFVLIILAGAMLLAVNLGRLPANQPFSTELRAQSTFLSMPFSFEPNQGQTDSEVDYLARGPGYTVYLTGGEAILVLRDNTKNEKQSSGHGLIRADSATLKEASAPEGESVAVTTLRIKLAGANSLPETSGIEELPGRSNYFIGNDPAKWRTDVPHYGKVVYHEVYPGIDLAYYGDRQQLEYDFIIAPGADPSNIRISFEGAEHIHIDEDGNLRLEMEGGTVIQQSPVIYQEANGERTPVEGGYLLTEDAQVSFAVTDYDSSLPLVIDPILSYSTFLGGSGLDVGMDIAVDANGNAYITGDTTSLDFPVTPGAFSNSTGPSTTVFITKMNPTGTGLVYSTFLGGFFSDSKGRSIALDSLGNAYVTGFTRASDFPTTPGVFQTALMGNASTFVTKLNSSGSGLVYSTYVGGSRGGIAFGITVDATDHAYITGVTGSNDFPTTSGALKTTCSQCANNISDAFVSKLNPTGSMLMYSTFLGGDSGLDTGHDIAVDNDGNTYITGETSSDDFPLVNPVQSLRAGNSDAFVSKLNPAGSTLIFSTLLGGSQSDVGFSIALDGLNQALVTGETNAGFFPVVNAIQPTSTGNPDAFVTKFTVDGNALVYSTLLGGTTFDAGRGIATDMAGNAYVMGQASPTGFPITSDAFQSSGGAFVSIISADGSTLSYSTYLGGGAETQGNGVSGEIAFHPAGDIYVTSDTGSVNFPVTPGAFQTTHGGSFDAFVTKFEVDEVFGLSISPLSTTISAGQSANFTVTVFPKSTSSGETVSFSCSNLPTASNCAFSPSTVTLGTTPVTTTLTISTTAPASTFWWPQEKLPYYFMLVLWTGILLLVLNFFFKAKLHSRPIRHWATTATLACLLLLLVACGGGGSTTPPIPPPILGTPLGTHTLTVMGSVSLGGTTLTHDTVFRLVVI